tara:strand:+ start:5812 stop:6930 length:1119 start_codon:yes stop_codon:yes gene_type:complete
MLNNPFTFKIKGDFGTVYITKDGIKDVAPETVPYVSNIHPDDDIIDRNSLVWDSIINLLYDFFDHTFKVYGHLNNVDVISSDICYPTQNNGLYKIDLIIYHGDVEISNTLGHKALLKGIYTKTILWASQNGVKFHSLYMFRNKLNSIEARNQFMHPHAPALRIRENGSVGWLPMCLGESDLWNHFFKRKRKNTDMSLYCMYLNSYIAWESREGGPYSTLENIYDCKNNKDLTVDNIDIDDIIYKYADVFEVVANGNELVVSSDFINKITIENITKTNSYGNYLDFDQLELKNTNFQNHTSVEERVLFKGSVINLCIENTDKAEITPYLSTLYNTVPKEILSKIKQRLSLIINFNYANNKTEEVRSTGVTTEG